jgi:hypothetical protein
MTTNPFDPDFVFTEEFKQKTIADLRARWDEAEKRRVRTERRRQKLNRLTFGLLGR